MINSEHIYITQYARHQALKQKITGMAVFWVLVPCNLVEVW
jgi:hypothetical protein